MTVSGGSWLEEALATRDLERKALSGHLAATGLRARGGEGAHRIVIDYARHRLGNVLSQDDLADIDDVRKDRALAEYGEFASRKLTADHVRTAADLADRVVSAIATLLAGRAPPKRRPR